jgi:predicted ATPase
MISYCGEKGLPPMVPLGKVFRGDALAQQGEFAEGIAQMREGIDELRSMRTLFSTPSFFPALASAHARLGNVDDGLAAVEEGLAMARTGGDHFNLPEMHRVRATLLLAHSAADKAAVQAAYGKAIEIAHSQHARLLELRAATGLARLLGEAGERSAASELLAPLCAAFTEGFDTLDLKDAKALLDELG